MAMREMKLKQARELVAAGKLEAIAIANMEGWPGEVNLTITVSEELASELDTERKAKIEATPVVPTATGIGSAPVVTPPVEAPKPGRKAKPANQEGSSSPAPAPAPTPEPTPEPAAEEIEEEAAEEDPA